MKKKNVIQAVVTVFCLMLILGLAVWVQDGKKAASGRLPEEKMELSKAEMLEDYEYLCRLLDEHYPFWEEIKEHGSDKEAIYNKYHELVQKVENTTEFYNLLANFYVELDGWSYGHFSFIPPKHYQSMQKLYAKYTPDGPWDRALSNEKTQKMYSFYSSESEDFVLKGTEEERVTKEEPTDIETENLELSIIGDGKIGYIKVPSFDDSYIEKEVPLIKQFIIDHQAFGNIIIDIRGNSGGNGTYWYKAFAKPNLTESVIVKMYYLFNENLITSEETGNYIQYCFGNIDTVKKKVQDLPEFPNESSYLDQYRFYMETKEIIEADKSVTQPYTGQFWVLMDSKNSSAASGFTEFCKQSGFAKLVGEAAGGDNCNLDPALFALPNSGFVVRFDLFYGVNGDGSCNAVSGTIPDITCESENALEVCQQEIAIGEPVEDTIYRIEDYGETTAVKKEFTNDSQQKTYYYTVDQFYFSDEKYKRVNQTLNTLYEDIISSYEDEAEHYMGDYELDSSIENEAQMINDSRFILNSITYVGEDYVSLSFNDCCYWAGAAHPNSCFKPITIEIETGAVMTPELILGLNWQEIREKANIEREDENAFNEEYGFYITDSKLVYIYRTNVYVELIEINRK